MSKNWIHFGQMAWPLPQCEHEGLAWRLRYAPETMKVSDLLAAAEVMCAYSALIFKTQKDRNTICSKLQEAINNQEEST